MATKQAPLTLEQVQQQKAELAKQLELLAQQETTIIEESKAEAFDALLEVVNKYRLNGGDIVKTLLVNRKIGYKEVQAVEPVYLISAKVQKKNRKTQAMEEGDFFYYEGKVILADAEQARFVCANGIDTFKNALTENGKKYLAEDNTKKIIIDFYNEYKPAQAQKWDGQ